MLRVENLTKSFHLALIDNLHVVAFENVSFSVGRGAFLGITAPSGAGKSSILKCIYRTYLPESGHIWFRSAEFSDVDLAAISERQVIRLRHQEMGYVTQFLKVIPRVSAVDIVAQRLGMTGVPMDTAREKSKEMLDRLRIPRRLWDTYPATFSGGEQQRVNLARAFIVRPSLLLLDEPTASLDAQATRVVLNLLFEMKRQGTAMVGVFHDRDLMAQIADEVLNLQTAQAKALTVPASGV